MILKYEDVLPNTDLQVGIKVQYNPFFPKNIREITTRKEGTKIDVIDFSSEYKIVKILDTQTSKAFKLSNGHWYVRNQVIVKGIDYE